MTTYRTMLIAAAIIAGLVVWSSHLARYSTTSGGQSGVYVTDRMFGIIWWCNVGVGGSVCVRVFPSDNSIP